MKNKKAKQDIYLDWVNNYITSSYMAERYSTSEEEMLELIETGRKAHLQLNFKGISLRSKFTVHGHYMVSNWGGYEIMISRDGESARVRDAYGDFQRPPDGYQ
jgi:hypothetical protein